METTKKPAFSMPTVSAEVDVDIDEFDEDEIVEYLEHLGYTVLPKDDSKTFQSETVHINAIRSPNLKDLEMEEVLTDLIAKYGYKLTDKLRELL